MPLQRIETAMPLDTRMRHLPCAGGLSVCRLFVIIRQHGQCKFSSIVTTLIDHGKLYWSKENLHEWQE